MGLLPNAHLSFRVKKNYYNKSHYFLSLTSKKQKGMVSLYSDKTCASDKYSVLINLIEERKLRKKHGT